MKRVTWKEAESVVNDPVVDNLLTLFADDPSHDSAVCLIRHVMQNALDKRDSSG